MLTAAITGDDVSRSKPHPDLIEVALDEVEAGKAVVVGDTVLGRRGRHGRAGAVHRAAHRRHPGA